VNFERTLSLSHSLTVTHSQSLTHSHSQFRGGWLRSKIEQIRGFSVVDTMTWGCTVRIVSTFGNVLVWRDAQKTRGTVGFDKVIGR